MNVHELYLRVRRQDIAYIKFIVESYELLGIIRTVDPREAVIVLLVLEDSLALARDVIEALSGEVPLEEVPRPAGLGGDWLLGELAMGAADGGDEA